MQKLSRFAVLVGIPLVMSTSATLQAEASEGLPARIQCHAKLQGDPERFEILDLDTAKPKSSIYDASLLEYVVNNYVTQVSFSNQCDNSYGFLFFTEDLKSLARGELKKVKGLVNYFNAEVTTEENPDITITQNVTCWVPSGN